MLSTFFFFAGQIVLPPGTNLTEQQKQALIQQQLQIQQQQTAARAGAQGQQFQGLQAQNQGNAQNQGQQQQNAAPVSTQLPATGAPSQFSQQASLVILCFVALLMAKRVSREALAFC